jgi:ADP-heptose:LPS heptosyltransferase
LVIRMDAIGDFVIWLSAGAEQIAEMARRHGHSVLLAKRDWADFAKSLNLFDEVWPVDTERLKRSPCYRFLLLARIRRAGFSLVIQTRAAREFLLEDSVIRVSGAESITGNLGNTRNIGPRLKHFADRWYTKLIEVPPESAHEMERSKAFCRALTGKEPRPVSVNFDPAIVRRLGVDQDYFLVAPGAGWPGRCWPAERFGEIAARLHRETGLLCVVVGSPEDRSLADIIVAAPGSKCLDLTGKATLLETGALLKHARLAIVNESGIAHFAPFVGTKAIVLLGGGHFGWFMPYGTNMPETVRPRAIYRLMECYGCDWKCKFDVPQGSAVPCLDRISVDEVWSAVMETGLGLQLPWGR